MRVTPRKAVRDVAQRERSKCFMKTYTMLYIKALMAFCGFAVLLGFWSYAGAWCCRKVIEIIRSKR